MFDRRNRRGSIRQPSSLKRNSSLDSDDGENLNKDDEKTELKV